MEYKTYDDQSPVSHFSSLLLALLVTFLWSTSFIIIKIGLEEIPPLIFAGLRYFLSFLILIPFILKKESLMVIEKLGKKDWFNLLILGILFYSITQGAQFIGLSLIPSVTVSLILSLTPIFVALISIFALKEIPSFLQICGILFFLVGIFVYFYPFWLSPVYLMGIVVVFLGVLANSFSSILGRKINREAKISPLVVTVISMGIGSIALLGTGLVFQKIPELNSDSLFYIIWLALVNTAFAFSLWNSTLRTLTAIESSVINGTMLFQIAILAGVFLEEKISYKEVTGMITASLGVLFVQLKIKRNFLKKTK